MKQGVLTREFRKATVHTGTRVSRSSKQVKGGALGTETEKTPNLLTVDVEDWFHILDSAEAPDRSQWSELPSRVEANTDRLLQIFADAEVRATFFVVGWIAWRSPGLVRRIAEAGHEIASHSFWHELVNYHHRDSFRADLATSKKLLEDLSGQPVQGFRAPGWSITPEQTWAFQILAEEGFQYDASMVSGIASHGGFHSPYMGPHTLELPDHQLVEVPLPTFGVGRWRFPYSGGGYLRLFPYSLVRSAAQKTRKSGEPVCVYVHPREIDPEQPRMENLPMLRKFKYYVGLKQTEAKLRRLLKDFAFVPISEWIASHPEQIAKRRYSIDRFPEPVPESSRVPPDPPAEVLQGTG